MRHVFLPALGVLMLCAAAAAQEAKPFVYDDHGRRDPMWRLVGPGGAILRYDTDFLITDLALEGIMAGAGGDNLAIINGRILETGDRIGQFSVEAIGQDSVTLRDGGEIFVLKLRKGGQTW